ncbi:uncharacterized protein B0P05DRAFT_152349 [Gilbertella persicaria]|uniref:uncharacterized protein n=1 Tax=Gilbertella persicaria TaxID=101096 RepID=UPI002220149E|nr:uncharacterized protein B0P05DRAFT_152349 [Gilbertella persicaria]KAI8075434.1 hypothetical protein B0P05DRAFT_152349 [Gilbertella persicaria]
MLPKELSGRVCSTIKHAKKTSVLVKELVSFINHATLAKNEGLIEIIWNRSKQLESTSLLDNHDSTDYFLQLKQLIQHGIELWNLTVEMNIYITKNERQKMKALAMLKDTCFHIFQMDQEWKKENYWTYLQMVAGTFRICLDCEDMESEQLALIDELKNVNKKVI